MNTFFKITERGSTLPRECLAGLVTFATMAYIVCVQPQIMSGVQLGHPTGMDVGALITTTCLAAAFGSILMGLWANYPIALAPGMGENFFVVMTIVPACAAVLGQNSDIAPWQTAIGVVFVTGILFALLTFFNIRKHLIGIISPSLRCAIAGGIGLLIALIGLKNAQVIVIENNNPALGSLTGNPAPLVFAVGLITATSLNTLKIKGAILFGILTSAMCALLFGKISLGVPIGLPADPMPIVGKMDIAGVFTHFAVLFPLMLILLFMQVFDTLGTVIGIGTQAGLMKNNEFPHIEKVFAADAAATVVGAVGGHSTINTYVESIAGVESGGRTGLTAIVTGLCFIAALFCSPFIAVIGSYPPITAAALVYVGAMMMQNTVHIDWKDPSETIPSFLILLGIVLTYSISDGIILGLLVYPVIKFCSGKRHQIGWQTYVLFTVLFLYAVCKTAV